MENQPENSNISDRREFNQMHPLRSCWFNMIYRCTVPHHQLWPYYGEVGVTVCEEWSNSYESFREWSFLNGWERGLELDRKDTNGNYEPENCRWVTHRRNMRNMKKTVWIYLDNERMSIGDAADRFHARNPAVPHDVIYNRMRLGWEEKDWNMPKGRHRR